MPDRNVIFDLLDYLVRAEPRGAELGVQMVSWSLARIEQDEITRFVGRYVFVSCGALCGKFLVRR